MNGKAALLVQAAEHLIGAPYRLHGRSRAQGLDCIGLLDLALAEAGVMLDPPQGYALRQRRLPDLAPIARRCGLVPVRGPSMAGDIVLLRSGPAQVHGGIIGAAFELIHAHAGLRRVVATPAPLPWPAIGQWRFLEG